MQPDKSFLRCGNPAGSGPAHPVHPDAARLTLNRSHDQTKHKDTQRRELQNRRQKLRRAGVRFQKQFFPVDRVVNRAATCGEWIDHGIPFSGICLEYAAAGLKYFLWKFDVFLARIVQKPPFVADDLKLQTFQRQVFFRKLLDLADSIAKQQNTLCESRSAARTAIVFRCERSLSISP